MGGLQSFPEFPSRTLVEGQSSWYQDFEKYPIGRILNDLDSKIKEWNDIIDNLKKGQMSREKKMYMFSQMIQTSDFLMSMVPPEFYTSFIKQGADHNTHIPYEHRHQQVPRHQEGHQSAHEEERKIRRDNAPPRPQTASPGGRNNELEKLKRENKELQTSLKDVQLVGEDLQREKELLLIRAQNQSTTSAVAHTRGTYTPSQGAPTPRHKRHQYPYTRRTHTQSQHAPISLHKTHPHPVTRRTYIPSQDATTHAVTRRTNIPSQDEPRRSHKKRHHNEPLQFT